MPFYQILCLTAHYPEYRHIRELVHKSAMHIMNNGGVVKNIDYFGTRSLPQRMRAHKAWYRTADYWLMHFVASPKVSRALDIQMRTDPRVIRSTTLKLGHRPEDMVDTGEKTVYRDSRRAIGYEMENRLNNLMIQKVREES